MSDKIIRKSVVPEIRVTKAKVMAALAYDTFSGMADILDRDYRAVLADVMPLLKPKTVFAAPLEIVLKDTFEETGIICELRSVGEAVSRYIENAFKEGNSVQALLASAIADEALFSMEDVSLKQLKDICETLGCGIKRRLRLPEMITAKSWRSAIESAAREVDIKMTDGLMLSPEKSLCVMYELSEDMCLFEAAHHCEDCDKLNCPRRTIGASKENAEQEKLSASVVLREMEDAMPKLKVYSAEGIEEVVCQNKETVMSALSRLNPKYEAVCGGTGRCGKCRIKLEEGCLPVTEADRRCFTKKELLNGWRLACMAEVMENVAVRPEMTDVSEMEVLTDRHELNEMLASSQADMMTVSFPEPVRSMRLQNTAEAEKSPYFYCIGIDIGTTTIAVGLYSSDGDCIDTYTALNRQRSFGADVLSRIQRAPTDGGRMRALVLEDISKGMEKLVQKYLRYADRIKNIGIAANTTMLHLLLGYPCESLGSAPFLPYRKESEQLAVQSLFENLEHPAFEKTEVFIYPGISAFVGADIVAGMTALDMAASEKIDLFIDLGTNGEMAVGSLRKLFVASTAAGPAFEGGNITWGTGSITGAICGAEFLNGKLVLKTIGGALPVGICGTGLIEVVCALIDAGIIDETGLLNEKYFGGGYPLARRADGSVIVLTQKDIRELQMAKASICAGVQTLMAAYGITEQSLNKVYIAGGFGYGLNYKKAVKIGLLPRGLETKICPVGNTALAGAALLAGRPEILEKSEKLASRTKEISLAESEEFQNYYIQNINFRHNVISTRK